VAGEKSAGQGHSFWQVPGTYSLAETNSDGNIKQRSAVCASEAKHCQKAGPWKVHMLNEPGSSNATISVTTGPFQGYHFFKNKASCIFITHVIIIQLISVFSFQYKFAFLTSFLQAEQSIETLDYIGCH